MPAELKPSNFIVTMNSSLLAAPPEIGLIIFNPANLSINLPLHIQILILLNQPITLLFISQPISQPKIYNFLFNSNDHFPKNHNHKHKSIHNVTKNIKNK